jgi:HPt (histidine-containing phosphotransfer) domain-containing protein
MLNKVIQQGKNEQEKPFDFELMLEELEGDRELFFEIVERFIHKVKMQLAAMREAITAGKLEAVVFNAHAIHGGASNLRMFQLAKIAFRLEKINLIQAANPEENFQLCKELEAKLHTLETYVSELLVNNAN